MLKAIQFISLGGLLRQQVVDMSNENPITYYLKGHNNLPFKNFKIQKLTQDSINEEVSHQLVV